MVHLNCLAMSALGISSNSSGCLEAGERAEYDLGQAISDNDAGGPLQPA
jgi:hypothetical protein